MPSPRRHALLAGVDCYPKLAAASQLRSCANDARLMADVLGDRFDFRRRDMTLLVNGEATHDAIVAGFADLRARARPGDAVVFFWSGHGARLPDPEGDEADGMDEAIVPSDSGNEPEEIRDIVDDEIHRWLLALSKVTTNVAVIADTCFSGGVVRTRGAGEKWIQRGAGPGGRRPAPHRGSRPAAGLRDIGPSGFLPVDERYVLLAACRSRETAKELKTQPYSAFTWHLCQELLRAPAGATYRDAMERVRLAVEAEVPAQSPQVEGARDRVLFGVARRPPQRFLPVLERQGSRVVLGGGAVHGVDRGATWALYPSGTRRPAGAAPRGLVRIESVEASRSAAEIVEERGTIAAGLRAFERAKGPGWLRLDVEVGGVDLAPSERRALAAALGRSSLLAVASAGEAAVRVLADGPSWVLESVENELLGAPIPRRARGAVSGGIPRVVAALETLARARNLLALEGDEESPLRGTLEVEILRGAGAGPLAPAVPDAGGDVVFREGDRFALRIVQRSERPLYLHVLDVGLAGAIVPLYPPSGDQKALLPGRPLTIGGDDEDPLVLSIPDDFAARALAAGRAPIEGREALKVLATTAEADLSVWAQPGLRGSGAPPAAGLEALVARALGGGGGLRGDPPPADPNESWTAVTLSFRVRREVVEPGGPSYSEPR